MEESLTERGGEGGGGEYVYNLYMHIFIYSREECG